MYRISGRQRQPACLFPAPGAPSRISFMEECSSNRDYCLGEYHAGSRLPDAALAWQIGISPDKPLRNPSSVLHIHPGHSGAGVTIQPSPHGYLSVRTEVCENRSESGCGMNISYRVAVTRMHKHQSFSFPVKAYPHGLCEQSHPRRQPRPRPRNARLSQRRPGRQCVAGNHRQMEGQTNRRSQGTHRMAPSGV